MGTVGLPLALPQSSARARALLATLQPEEEAGCLEKVCRVGKRIFAGTVQRCLAKGAGHRATGL